jgi:hypothetical protein
VTETLISVQGAHISLDGQLKNHQVTVSKIAGLLGNNVSAATEYLNKCLYSVGMGNNDYINNYFLPKHYPTKRLYSQNQYAQVLIDQYSQQIKVRGAKSDLLLLSSLSLSLSLYIYIYIYMGKFYLTPLNFHYIYNYPPIYKLKKLSIFCINLSSFFNLITTFGFFC